VFDSVTSTNDVALALATDPAHFGVAVLADQQTAGRGQFGRAWQAPPGTAIQLSVTLDPPVELRRPVVLTAWAAVAVAETVRKITNTPARIKWPNDVLLHGCKVAGILIEQKAVVVAGIGLNVNQSTEQFAADGLFEAGSLASVTGRTFDRDAIAKQLLLEMDAEYDSLLAGELGALESRWAWHVGLLGRSVTAERLDGTRHHGWLRELTFHQVVIESPQGGFTSAPPEGVRQLRTADDE
jgi:BirA family biotin operon repressor/biotin-[acetyl-CoA-carboxylase] ligase